MSTNKEVLKLWIKRLVIFVCSGFLFMWVTFWTISGSPWGMFRFFFVYYISDTFFMDPVSKEELFNGALKGIVEALKEPHSQYLDKKAYDNILAQTESTYGGIGVVLAEKDGFLVVVSAIEDQPAAKAGIKTGDLIVSVDGKDIKNQSFEEVAASIRGEAGTSVTLGIKENDEIKSITIKREKILVPTVKSKMIDEHIGYIRISHFAENTGTEFADAYKELQKKGMTKLILDLRGNPGGLLTAATDVADYILPAGPIVSIKERTGVVETYDSEGLEKPIPLVVLMNEGSASASEIIAGAVQDEKVGTIVGTKSYGKGTVQTVIPGPGHSAVKITIAKYHTPNDRVIDGIGIEPDVLVALPKT